MPRHQIIYTHGGGQLGNQVLRFAHWIAWAREHAGEVEVRDLAFWPYAKHFATWRAHPGCVFPVRPDAWDGVARGRQLLPRWLQHRLDWRVQHYVHARGARRDGTQAVTLDVATGETLDLEDAGFLAGVRRHRVTTCAGWRIASWNLVARHEAALREFFQPAADELAGPRAELARLRESHGFILGVHIRQGDYRTWHDGRFLFSPADYARWIRQALELHAARRPMVVVVSDEPVDAAVFQGLPVHVRRNRPAFADWVILSQCDQVLGPPSTFAATAAWVGKKPLWPVSRRDQVLDPAQIIPDGIVGAARHPEFGLAVR